MKVVIPFCNITIGSSLELLGSRNSKLLQGESLETEVSYSTLKRFPKLLPVSTSAGVHLQVYGYVSFLAILQGQESMKGLK